MRVPNHETDWDHRRIYVEYATFRLFEYQRVGTLGPGKSLAVPAEPLEQAIHRMAGVQALPPPRSYHGRHVDRRQRVEEGGLCRSAIARRDTRRPLWQHSLS